MNGMQAKKAVKQNKAVMRCIEAIPTPEGFTKTVNGGYHDGTTPWWDEQCRDTINVVLQGAEVRLVFNLRSKKRNAWPKGELASIMGHTLYERGGHWHNLSRRGIEDSFYATDKDDLNAIVEREIKRALEAKKAAADFVAIPGFGWSINKSRIENVRAKLRKGQSHTFAPHGMGTANALSTRRSSFARPASKETNDFFGVGPLWITNIDWD
jgi:hypothetical protein